MKVLHLIQKPQYRGAETFTCQLATHQKKMGLNVKIACIFPGEAQLSWEDEIIILGGKPNSRFIDYNAWKNLSRLVESFEPDIIQANAGDTLKYAVFSKKLFGWKIPVIFRNASEVGRYLNSGFQKRFNSYLYRNVVGVASVSEASKKDIIKHFPFLKNRTKVIPIGLENVNSIKPLQLKPEKVRHIVHVGGFSFEKNHKALLHIFKLILEKEKNVHLHFIGDGDLKSDIEKLTKKLSLCSFVTFYGYQKNPLPFIKSADVLVLPSIIEGLPGVILEAMYCETPVVAYDVGGIPEILSKETGELIPANNESKFADAVEKILNSEKYEKPKKALKVVRKNYMNSEIAKRFNNFYFKVKSDK